MGFSSDNDSKRVQTLLRVKRYEQPPPRYFNEFSGRVIARIERGEARTSWWERFGFDLRPALAAATGVFACALVVYGVATADEGQPVHVEASSGLSSSPLLVKQSAPDILGSDSSVSANSTNPVSKYGTPIDRTVFRPQVVPVSYPLR